MPAPVKRSHLARCPDKSIVDPAFDVSATTSSGLSPTFTATGECTVLGNRVSLTGVGNCAITAHQPGNPVFDAAPDVTQAFFRLPGRAIINFGALPDRSVRAVLFQLNAVASSGLAVQFTAREACTGLRRYRFVDRSGDLHPDGPSARNSLFEAAPDVTRRFSRLSVTYFDESNSK